MAMERMKHRRRIATGRMLGGALSMALLACPMAARAEPLARQAAGLSKEDGDRATVLAFGRCTVRTRRAMTERVLAMPPLEKATNAALSQLANTDCLRDGDVPVSFTLMRGSLYAALYRVDFGVAPAAAPFAAPLDFTADVGEDTTREAQQYLWLHQFADCVVRDDPASSRALLLAEVGSESEQSIFATLAPHFSACMPSGQSLTFNKAVLEGLIAESLYRHSKAQALPRKG